MNFTDIFENKFDAFLSGVLLGVGVFSTLFLIIIPYFESKNEYKHGYNEAIKDVLDEIHGQKFISQKIEQLKKP